MKDHQLSRRLAATFPLTFVKLRPLLEAARDGEAFSFHLSHPTPPSQTTTTTTTTSLQSDGKLGYNSGNHSFTFLEVCWWNLCRVELLLEKGWQFGLKVWGGVGVLVVLVVDGSFGEL